MKLLFLLLFPVAVYSQRPKEPQPARAKELPRNVRPENIRIKTDTVKSDTIWCDEYILIFRIYSDTIKNKFYEKEKK